MILNELEKELQNIQEKSMAAIRDQFYLSSTGVWILKSEQERFEKIFEIMGKAREFDEKYGKLISDYKDAFGKEAGFEEFLNKMAKINPDHSEVIKNYLNMQAELREYGVSPVVEKPKDHDIIYPETPVSNIVEEAELVGEPEQAVENKEQTVEQEQKQAIKVKVVKVRKSENAVEKELAPAEEPKVEVSTEIPVVEPVVSAPVQPEATPVVEAETPIIEVPEEVLEEKLEDLEEINFEIIQEQIADKKQEIKENKVELKELRVARRQAVRKRRKYNWEQKVESVKTAFGNAKKAITKKAVVVKGIGILETSINKNNDYRKVYLEIEKFYLAYPSRSAEENLKEIDRLSAEIGGSELLTIKEKMRLYRKLQRLSRLVAQQNKKNQQKENTNFEQLITESESLLDGLSIENKALER